MPGGVILQAIPISVVVSLVTRVTSIERYYFPLFILQKRSRPRSVSRYQVKMVTNHPNSHKQLAGVLTSSLFNSKNLTFKLAEGYRARRNEGPPWRGSPRASKERFPLSEPGVGQNIA